MSNLKIHRFVAGPLALMCAVWTWFNAAAAEPLTVETGGYQLVLPAGWEALPPMSNLFVQFRGRHAESKRTVSAGSAMIPLTLPQYVAVGLVTMMPTNHPPAKLAETLNVPQSEIDKALASPLGRQALEEVKRAAKRASVELLKFTREESDGQVRFEVHAKITPVKPGPVIYSRQFFLPGGTREIVQITFGGVAEDVLHDPALAATIRPKKK